MAPSLPLSLSLFSSSNFVWLSSSKYLRVSMQNPGVSASWNNQAMRRVYRQSIKYWMATCCGVYIFGLLLFLPISILLIVVDLLFRLGLWEAFPMWSILGQISLAIPMIGALFIRSNFFVLLDLDCFCFRDQNSEKRRRNEKTNNNKKSSLLVTSTPLRCTTFSSLWCPPSSASPWNVSPIPTFPRAPRRR